MNKTKIDLSKVEYADGKILRYIAQGDSLTLLLKNWQEDSQNIILSGVLGMSDLGIIGQELSHCEICENHELINTLKNLHSDDEKYLCFKLWSADNDERPLLLVAFQDGYCVYGSELESIS